MPYGLFQFAGAAVNAAPDLLFRQQRKETLHQVDPRRSGGRKVHVIVRTLNQPLPDERRFMRAVIVQNEMHLHSRRHCRLDGVEELAELQRAVAAMQSAHDFSRLGIQGRKQRGRTMTEIIVASPLRLAGTHGSTPWLPSKA